MAKKRAKKKRETGWLTRAEMCRMFDISEQAFTRVRRVFPEDAVRTKDGRLWFYGRACLEAWAKDRYGDGDPLLGESTPGDSPALERYREERAAMARLDRLEREDQLIPRADVHNAMTLIFTPLRHGIDQIRRRWGNEVALPMEEAQDEAMRAITEIYGPEARP